MRNVQTLIVIVGLVFTLSANAENNEAPKVMNKIEPLPRDLEIELALSALPPHFRDNATVYTLNPDEALKLPARGLTDFMRLLLEPAMMHPGDPGP